LGEEPGFHDPKPPSQILFPPISSYYINIFKPLGKLLERTAGRGLKSEMV